MSKTCKVCGVEKNISYFYTGRKDCKDCKNAAARKKYVEDPETTQRNLIRMRERAKERRYGITQEDFDRMLSDQNNMCKICKNEFKSTKDTHIDHCHNSSVVRGLLCNNCNMALGQFGDNTDIMNNAIKYLVDWNII
jgi:hypothetical protein